MVDQWERVPEGTVLDVLGLRVGSQVDLVGSVKGAHCAVPAPRLGRRNVAADARSAVNLDGPVDDVTRCPGDGDLGHRKLV